MPRAPDTVSRLPGSTDTDSNDRREATFIAAYEICVNQLSECAFHRPDRHGASLSSRQAAPPTNTVVVSQVRARNQHKLLR
jgi:hypothetical protein